MKKKLIALCVATVGCLASFGACDFSNADNTGDEHQHVFSETWETDGENHWKQCECGEKNEITAHSGGEATCSSSAECSVCGESYGEIDASAHTSEEFIYVLNEEDETKHDKKYDCCDAVVETVAHSGGEATCKTAAICEFCEESYGEIDADAHESEEYTYTVNADDNTKHNAVYACCEELVYIEEHTDTDNNGKCDFCDATVEVPGGEEPGEGEEEHVHSGEYTYTVNAEDSTKHDKKHKCCGELIETVVHTGGEATCTDKAVCTDCGTSYGELAEHSGEYTYTVNAEDNTKHDKKHKCCGELIETVVHTGGEATCTDKAVCTDCGTSYGELAEHSGEYTYTVNAEDNTKHDKKHKCCGELIETVVHTGGEATCTDKAVCTDCGTPYGELAEHSGEYTYTVNAEDNTKHDKKHKCCGELIETVVHTGGEATCTDKAVCTDCKTAYGELGDHNWTTEGNKETCSVCGSSVETVATELYAVASEDKYAITLTNSVFVVDEEYTVTVNGATATAIVTEAGKLTVEFTAEAGTTYSVVCVKDKTTVKYTNVLAVTSVIMNMESFASIFTAASYYTSGINGYYVLGGDINASEYTLTHGAVSTATIGLTGTFDGKNHTISGLSVGASGLFGAIGKGATVKDLSLTDMKFVGSEAFGLAKYITTCTIENVSMEITALSSSAWAQAAIAYKATVSGGRSAINNLTVEMMDTRDNAYVLGAHNTMASGCKYTNAYVVSNNVLISGASGVESDNTLTQVTWTLQADVKKIYTESKGEYSNTTTYSAVVMKGGETQTLVWKSSNEAAALVDGGVVTAQAVGTTTISAEYTDSVIGKTYTFVLAELSVDEVPTEIAVTETSFKTAFGVADDDNILSVSDFASDDTDFVITSIADENNETMTYADGKVTISQNVEVGKEYTWIVSNGTYGYSIKVFVATNVIKDKTDLDAFFNYSASKDYYKTGANGYYVLNGNINANGYTHAHGKTDSSGIGLTGTFDGRGYAIDGITLTNAGLFGFVKGGTIKNVALTNVTVQSSGEAYVITRQSNGMTIDNVFISVAYTEDSSSWNQGLFEKAWGAVSVSNVMVVATGGNANAFALGAMYAGGNPANYTYTNVYAISALGAVRVGESTGITIYADVATFKANVTTNSLTNFNEYWDLNGDYPVFTKAK